MSYLQTSDILQSLKSFDRDEGSFKEDVNNLQDWLQTQTHLPEIMDKKRIESFLLMNKCKIEKTKARIDMFYTIRSIFPELYSNLPSDKGIEEATKMAYFVPLPKLTPNQNRIFLYKVRDTSLVDIVEPLNIAISFLNTFEIRLFEDNAFDDIYIYDMENLTLNYITKLLPHIPKLVQVWENVFSMRIKAVYVLNGKSYMTMLLNLVKGLVKAKIFERIHILDTNAKLLDLFPKEILPKDFGGDEKSLEDLWKVCLDRVQDKKEYFEERRIRRVNEKLRVELNNDESLGFYGNFKKLNVD